MDDRLKEFDRMWRIAFKQSLEREHVYYESKETDSLDMWLSFYIKNIKTYIPSKDKDIWWSLACSFNVKWYSPTQALQRAIAFYVSTWVRAKQDVNGILDENVLVKKSK